MPWSSSILILGSDVQERAALATQLETEANFGVMDNREHKSPFTKAELERIDAVLIVRQIDDDFMANIFESDYRGPIIGLSFHHGSVTEEIALPVKANFLLQRIKSHIRNFQSRSDMSFSIGPFRLYPATRILVSSDGGEQKLTDKEVEILRYLHRARGAVVSRDELLTHIWGFHESVTTHTLETHIYRIRQKIEMNADMALILLTEAGGYRLADQVLES